MVNQRVHDNIFLSQSHREFGSLSRFKFTELGCNIWCSRRISQYLVMLVYPKIVAFVLENYQDRNYFFRCLNGCWIFFCGTKETCMWSAIKDLSTSISNLMTLEITHRNLIIAAPCVISHLCVIIGKLKVTYTNCVW